MAMPGRVIAAETAVPAANSPRRVLWGAGAAHALHDGYTDLIYVLLPVWQAEFGLSYAALGTLRALYSGTMASLQVPASLLASRMGAVPVLAAGTALAGIAYLSIGLTGAGFVLLAALLLLGGAGAATQHPLASALVSRAYEARGSRAALGTYNFAGDLGKMALPLLLAGLMLWLNWRAALGLVGLLGIGLAVALLFVLPRIGNGPVVAAAPKPAPIAAGAAGGGVAFALLLAIGVLDSATRMGFLAFLPFVLRESGAGLETIGLGLTLVFAGGAAGKLACGYLGARLGVLTTVLMTETATAIGILALGPLPLLGALACLPLVGLALNGTSSVLYGTVPELVAPEKRERAFGIFYTGTIGGGAMAPVAYGFVGDAVGPGQAMAIVACVCLLTLPLAVVLSRYLRVR